jgi:hypothetical protein
MTIYDWLNLITHGFGMRAGEQTQARPLSPPEGCGTDPSQHGCQADGWDRVQIETRDHGSSSHMPRSEWVNAPMHSSTSHDRHPWPPRVRARRLPGTASAAAALRDIGEEERKTGAVIPDRQSARANVSTASSLAHVGRTFPSPLRANGTIIEARSFLSPSAWPPPHRHSEVLVRGVEGRATSAAPMRHQAGSPLMDA